MENTAMNVKYFFLSKSGGCNNRRNGRFRQLLQLTFFEITRFVSGLVLELKADRTKMDIPAHNRLAVTSM